jgi:uncharacterized protein YciI
MPHYLIEYRELGNASTRESLRPDHVAYRKGLGSAMALAGPLLSEDNQPTGSVVIVEATDLEAAQVLAQADPYVAGGVLECVAVRRYRIAAMKPPQG